MITIALLVLFVVAFASAEFGPRVVMDTPVDGMAERKGWSKMSRVAGDEIVELHFALSVPPQAKAALDGELMRRSDPDSPLYGKWLSKAQVDSLVAPRDDDVDVVKQWVSAASENTAKIVRNNVGFLRVYVAAKYAESMLDCHLHVYRHKDAPYTIYRTEEAHSLPASVANVVDFVAGMHRFPRAEPMKVKPQLAAQKALSLASKKRVFDLVIDPRALRQLYKVGSTVGSSKKFNQTVAQFIGQTASISDLEEFFFLFWSQGDSSLVSIIGPDGGFLKGLEASLDLQYVTSLGSGIPTILYSVANKGPGTTEPFLTWMQEMDAMSDAAVPKVASVSYGDSESDLNGTYLDRVEVEFKKQGVRGISVLFASGDSGVGCAASGAAFGPDWPASSPSVTSVGATVLAEVVSGSEGVATLSGGGFSNHFPQPAYQRDHVQKYLSNPSGLPPKTFFNASGNAYPTVSAMGENFIIVIDKIPMPGVAGTSAASPTFAGVLSLLVDLRMQAGKGSLGYLNPMLFKAGGLGSQLNKMTTGSNSNCGTNGFPARPGDTFSPSGGLGTPDYEKMAAYIKSLP